MPKLSELTDYAAPAETISEEKGTLAKVTDKLFGLNGQDRYQLWPEKMVRDALTAIPTVSQPNPYPEGSESNYWFEDQRQKAMIPAALNMSALAGTGGIAGTGKGAGTSLGIVPVDVAKKLNFKTAEHPEILKQAAENTPAASIDADGHLVVNVIRRQMSDQAGNDSVRGGVFYSPSGNEKGTWNGKNNYYGGSEKITGDTAYKNPLVVKGKEGGEAPAAAYDQLLGKGSYRSMTKDVNNVTTSGVIYGYDKKLEMASDFLNKYAPEISNMAEYIVKNSPHGNQLSSALSEAAIASAVRKAGHDGVIGYTGKRPKISEIYDVRENRYPSPEGDYSVHPELYSSGIPGYNFKPVDHEPEF